MSARDCKSCKYYAPEVDLCMRLTMAYSPNIPRHPGVPVKEERGPGRGCGPAGGLHEAKR